MKKVAINGFGRIGRTVFKELIDTEGNNLEVVAINDLTDIKTLAHLLKYDSVYGQWDGIAKVTEDSIFIFDEKGEQKEVKVFSERDPQKLSWGKLEVDVVLECTGIFTDKKGAGQHLKAGAKKVIISAPT
ncbi:MAG: type I glyceraldehyde-3-phosphate dehydrogenase, partial [Methanosarcinales archaeon]|nr:type I glyceraldehyde-3-phosphate dehydrogenase [Methanosarcinales archaeon]